MLIFFVRTKRTITISTRDKIKLYSSIVSYLFIVPFHVKYMTIDRCFNALYLFYLLHKIILKFLSQIKFEIFLLCLLNENE